MPRYDFHCAACGRTEERVSTIAARHDQVCACGAPLTKLMTSAAAVQDDTIIGGFKQEHFGHEPEVFYSKKEMARRAKELGLQPFVRHIGTQGSDKNPHTSRWF